MNGWPTIVVRIKTPVGGLLFTAFAIVFVFAGVKSVVQSAHRAATYLPATATVQRVTGTDLAADKVVVVYSFLVDGIRYTGMESAEEDSTARFKALQQLKPGCQLTVYYDPRDPSRCQRSVKADASGLVFTIFGLPFLALGLNRLWLWLSGREIVASRRPDGGGDAVPGGGMFWIFVLNCVLGAVGQLAVCIAFPWPWSLAGGLVILLVAIPAANLVAARLVRRWNAPERDGADLDADEDAAGQGKKLAILLSFTIIWCGGIGAVTYLGVRTLLRHYDAQARFASTPGVVLSSKIKVSRDEDGTVYEARIKYRYTVAGREYVGKRYDFEDVYSSDDSYAGRAVDENPAGRTVTVYYDPDDPSESILHLEVPGRSYFLLFFLQPFQLAGLAAIGWCTLLLFSRRRRQEFFRSGTSRRRRSHGRGVMQSDFDEAVPERWQNLVAALGHFCLGYGLACVALILVVSVFFHGTGDANVDAIRWAFYIAVAVGVAAMARRLMLPAAASRQQRR